MIPAPHHPPQPGRGAWRLVGAVAALLALGVAVRLVSPAVFLDIASLWPVAAVLVAAGWAAKNIWADRMITGVPLIALLVFSWLLISVSFYFAGFPGLPSTSADLRGPPADEAVFDTFSVELAAGRLLVGAGTGPAAYRVDMVRGGGGAGVPVAVESRRGDGGEVRVIDARRPLPADLGVTVDDNAWLRFAGWEVILHPGTAWTLTLTSPELSADLRTVPIAALAVNGGGTVELGEPPGPVPITINGTFTVAVPPQAPVRITGAAVVPEEWTVTGDTAWSGEPGSGWQIQVTEGAAAQVVTAPG